MTLSKNNNITVSLDPDLKLAQDAINSYRATVTSPRLLYADKAAAAIQFEDAINPLYGIIQNQTEEERKTIEFYCLELKLLSQANGITLNLHDGLLPNVANTAPQATVQIGKKLFPRTESVAVAADGTVEQTSGTVASAQAGISATGKVLNSDGTVSSSGSGAGAKEDAGTGTPSSGETRSKSQVATGGSTASNTVTVSAILQRTVNSPLSPKVAEAVAAAANAAKAAVAAELVAQNNPPAAEPPISAAAIPAIPTNEVSAEVIAATAAAANSAVEAAANTASESTANGTQQVAATATTTTTAAAAATPDPLFDLIDAAANSAADLYKNTPISNLKQEAASLLPAGLLALVKSATSNSSNTLDQDLAVLCTNPVAAVQNVIQSLSDYANNNFAALDAALPLIAADVNLATQYANLKISLAGSDGLSGTLAMAKAFEEHALRISGILVENTSPYASETWDSGPQNITYSDIPTSVATDVIVFDATRFRSAKYYIQATSGSEHQMTEYSVIHDNAIVYGREINTTYTIDPFVSFTSELNGTNVSVIATSTLPNTNLVIYGIRLKTAKSAKSYPDMSQFRILENHKTVKSYYNDDVDYVAQQTSSLTATSIFSLARSIEDLIVELTGPGFVSSSTLDKQLKIDSAANNINTLATELQQSIETDHNVFVNLSKRIEVLKMASNWSELNQDASAKKLLDMTLNQSVRENLV
jgi:hypothetical protein